MVVYNPTNSQLQLPLSGKQTLTIPAKGTSEVFLANKEFLSLIVTSFDYGDIYLITSGPDEVAFCSTVSCVPGFVKYSVEEAVEDYENIQKTKEEKK